MRLNLSNNYSINFNKKKRYKKNIKFIILHYTGMKDENQAIKKLTEIQSEVSSHFFVKKNGKIMELVPVPYIAWHAGKSSWGKKKSLNKSSIGIEISNPGHDFNYPKFKKKQISSIILLLRFLIKKYRIKKKNILGHSDIAPDRKKDPGEKFPWKILAKNKVSIWHNINKSKLAMLRKNMCNKTEINIFYKNLLKIGYKKEKTHLLTKAFQMRFRPELINGKVDKECLKISKSIAKI